MRDQTRRQSVRNRRLRGVALFGTSALLAACGSSGGSAASGPGTVAGPNSSTTQVKAYNPSGPRTTITVWTYWNQKFFPSLEKAFDDTHKNLKLVFTPIPLPPSAGVGSYAIFTSKLTTAEISHTQPSLIVEDQTSAASWAKKGLIQPVSPLLKTLGISSSQYPKSDWTGSFTWDGKLWGIPIDWDPDNMLYYNKLMMKAAGIASPPKTFAQLWVDAKRETKKKGSSYATMGFIPWEGWGFNDVGWATMYGGGPISTNGAVNLASQPMVSAESWEERWTKAYGGVAINKFTSSVPTGADPFELGKLGFMVTGDWELPGIASEAPHFKFGRDWGITTAPTPTAAGANYLASGWGWTIPKGAPHLTQTVQVLRYLASPSFVTAWCKAIGWLPASNSILKTATSGLTKEFPGFAPFIQERLTHPNLGPELPAEPSAEPVSTALSKIEGQVEYLKGGSPQAVLKAAQKSLSVGAGG